MKKKRKYSDLARSSVFRDGDFLEIDDLFTDLGAIEDCTKDKLHYLPNLNNYKKLRTKIQKQYKKILKDLKPLQKEVWAIYKELE